MAAPTSSSPFQFVSDNAQGAYNKLSDISNQYVAQPFLKLTGATTGFVDSVRNKVLTGFGLGSGVIFLVLGLVYFGLVYKYGQGGCSKDFETYAYSLGAIYIALAFVTAVPAITEQIGLLKILIVAIPLILFGLQLWGYIILFRDSGLDCQRQNSSTKSLWLGLTVLSILGTAGLGAVSLAVPVNNAAMRA